MKKSDAERERRGWICTDYPSRVSLRSATQGRIRIDWPDDAPVRFTRNLAAILKHCAAKKSAAKSRAVASLLRLYRRDVRLTEITQRAQRALDEKNWRILIKALAREMKSPFLVKLPVSDLAICVLDEEGALAGRTMKEQSECVSRWMRYHIGLDAYRKRVERLRRIPGTNFRSI